MARDSNARFVLYSNNCAPNVNSSYHKASHYDTQHYGTFCMVLARRSIDLYTHKMTTFRDLLTRVFHSLFNRCVPVLAWVAITSLRSISIFDVRILHWFISIWYGRHVEVWPSFKLIDRSMTSRVPIVSNADVIGMAVHGALKMAPSRRDWVNVAWPDSIWPGNVRENTYEFDHIDIWL